MLEYGIQPPPAYDYGVQRQQQQSNVTVIVNQARPVERRVVAVDYKPPNYVTLSIITMLCFCWILGLIGLILALQVSQQMRPFINYYTDRPCPPVVVHSTTHPFFFFIYYSIESRQLGSVAPAII